MLSTKCQFIRESGFRGEDFFLEINQSEARMACGGHVCIRIGTKLAAFIEDIPQMLPTKFRFIWPSGFREDFFKNWPIRNKNGLQPPCLPMDRDKMSNLYRKPSIDDSYQISIHLGKRFQRRIFFQKSTNQKKEWLVTAMLVNGSGRNQQSLQRTFHRCFLPNFTSFGKAVSEQTIFFRIQPIKNKNGLQRPCLLTDRN